MAREYSCPVCGYKEHTTVGCDSSTEYTNLIGERSDGRQLGAIHLLCCENCGIVFKPAGWEMI